MMNKEVQYGEIISRIKGLVKDEDDIIPLLANSSSILFHQLSDISWAGYYLLKGEYLVLGPFQGTPGCIRIKIGEGVCGQAVLRHKSIIVPDVHKFPGHIFCDQSAQSEIVVPIIDNENIYGVIDLDSHKLDNFDDTDRKFLEEVAQTIAPVFRNEQ